MKTYLVYIRVGSQWIEHGKEFNTKLEAELFASEMLGRETSIVECINND